MSPLRLFFSVYGIIFAAELPDKTALTTLVLATRRKATLVFAASASALALQCAIAVAAGGLLAGLPHRPVAITSAAVFLISALVMWRKRDEEEPEKKADDATGWKTFTHAFAAVFLAELGDLTQIGAAALSARYGQPLVVFAGAVLGLWSVSLLAVVVGHHSRRVLQPKVVRKVAAVLFALVGLAMLRDV